MSMALCLIYTSLKINYLDAMARQAFVTFFLRSYRIPSSSGCLLKVTIIAKEWL